MIGDESKINNSDVYEPSFVNFLNNNIEGIPQIGRSHSILTDNALDRNRFLIDNFDLVEFNNLGPLSYQVKLRGKTTGTIYLMKCIRKIKYGKF